VPSSEISVHNSFAAEIFGNRVVQLFALFAALCTGLPVLAMASSYEPDEPYRGHFPAPAFEIYGSAAAADEAATADRDYAGKMRKHHQGAVSMSEAYLVDPRGTHPVIRRLAEAIIANQNFEIAVLDTVDRAAERARGTVYDLLVSRQAGYDGLEHESRFVKWPPPGFFELWLDPQALSVFDVQFAKGMIIHHQAAIDMARTYNADSAADNGILKAMNRNIVIDQRYEIELLKKLIRRYPGNPDEVTVDPGMIHGMPDQGADHGEHGR
jgi:uncharacterized protein (DUF305 family)